MSEESRGEIRFTLDGARRGARAILPIVPGAVAFGLVYGFLAGERGLTVLEIALTSMLVFAGASQFLALELWQQPLPIAALVLGVLVINLRHALMGPTLLPWLAGIRPARPMPASSSWPTRYGASAWPRSGAAGATRPSFWARA